MKDIIKNIVDQYDIGPNSEQSRVGLVLLAKPSREVFDLDDYVSNESVKEAVDALTFEGTVTDITR